VTALSYTPVKDEKKKEIDVDQESQRQEDVIGEALRLPANAISYTVTQQLATLFPHQAIIESDDVRFDVNMYSEGGQCTITELPSQHNEMITRWIETDWTDAGEYAGGYRVQRAYNAWQEIHWREMTLTLLTLNWVLEDYTVTYRWLIADTEQQGHQFVEEVCHWCGIIHGEILVYEDGCWEKNARLFQSIKYATFDNLILQGTLKEDILSDLHHFFTSHSIYQHYHIPWKRGILFIGTPGNGKTHMVKALINILNQPCIYVKNFKSRGVESDESISAVFAKARNAAPCLLVLEDLDALLSDVNRSFFLNELDGFASNEGVVVLATTNHPERLDAAILERPSRFDRKYHFNLPEMAERAQYIRHWNTSLQEDICNFPNRL
jgi:hypothetical protein